ncbi:MAG: hypothetical protein WKF96_00165 [Solirubrobacteraceae bacterium]
MPDPETTTDVTTKSDLHDLGAPMLPGDTAEPQGPEDALGEGLKRGDYRDRILTDPHTSVPLEGGGEPVTRWVNEKTGAAAKKNANGAIEVTVDFAPRSQVVSQLPRAEEIGDAGGIKGGVETDPASPVGRGFAAGQAAGEASLAEPSDAKADGGNGST